MVELLLLTVSQESETKTDKYQFQYTTTTDIDIDNSTLLSKFHIPRKGFSFDSFFSIQKVIITQPSHLIIKNIKKADYNFDSLKKELGEFGKISELRVVDDCSQKENYICFVNFLEKKDAFKCIEEVTSQRKWFANYHIERLERDKTQILESKQESDESKFKKVYVSLQNSIDQKKILKQIKTHNVEVILPPFENVDKNLQINKFDGFKLLLKICKMLKDKEAFCNITSFTYNHGYFLIKFAEHEQALDCIKCLSDVRLDFLNEELFLKPQRANLRKSIGKSKRESFSLNTDKIFNYQSNSMTEIFKNRQSLKNNNSLLVHNVDSRSPSISSISCSPKFKSFNEVDSSSSILDLDSSPKKENWALPNSQPVFNETVFSGNEYFPVPIPVPYPVLMSPMNNFQVPPPFLNYGIKPPIFYNSPPPMYSYPYSPQPAKQSANKSMSWSYPIPSSMHQHSNLYFQNLPFSWTDKDLFDFVASYLEQTDSSKDPEKEIISYKVITQNFHENQSKGSSKGYGFVSFSDPLVASKCAYYLNMYELDKSEYEDENEKKPPAESIDDEHRYKLKVSFAMKRGRSLELANSKPIVMNKQFMECLEAAI